LFYLSSFIAVLKAAQSCLIKMTALACEIVSQAYLSILIKIKNYIYRLDREAVMSRNRKSVKPKQNFYRLIRKFSPSAIKKQIIWLLRSFIVAWRKPKSVNAGFVLPTVAMVALVVVLLTTAILFRSFERSKNASNVRVNEAVLNATAPAIDRARAKLDALFEDSTLPRGTPSDNALYDALKKDQYRLGDETRLKLAVEINGTAGIQQNTTNLEEDETSKTAWKFPVDTDNDGKFDTFTLYSINFRSPGRNAAGNFTRERSPLDARTPPMDISSTNQQCASATGFSTLVGNSSWYRLQSGNLGKSFFVYAVNVPISESDINQLPASERTRYKKHEGGKGFVALELQQDRNRIPLPNNAVWFENDLEITPGAPLALNGRIHTNSNLLVGGDPDARNPEANITLRQVSSINSCFYNQENGQIVVGGNVGNGSVGQTTDQKAVTVDLYKGFKKTITTSEIKGTNKSVDSLGGSQIGFNDAAFNERIARMKADALNLCTSCNDPSFTNGKQLKAAVKAFSYPDDIKRNVEDKVKDTDAITIARQVLANEIELYLKNRTRRVPFAEVADASGAGALTGYVNITANLKPQAAWREPVNASNQLTATSLQLNRTQLEATDPVEQKKLGIQSLLGDRILVGNNLPAIWQKADGSDARAEDKQTMAGANWNAPRGAGARWRQTQIQPLADLGLSRRNGFWEEKAAETPINTLDSVGGVRIVTGAGIYRDDDVAADTPNYPRNPTYNASTNPFPALLTNNPALGSGVTAPPLFNAQPNIVVWPDTMPMSSRTTTQTNTRGDLLMRATAVYHYQTSSKTIAAGTDQQPIACVSSYYDPTDNNSARNRNGLPVNAATNLEAGLADGRSNNGIVYNFPGRSSFAASKALLERQARLVFPNGRVVNQPLRDALAKIGANNAVTGAGVDLELADYSAIDTALCSIAILNDEADGTLTSFVATPTGQPAHGAIKESSFLDAREVKQIATLNTSTSHYQDTGLQYNVDLEQRQPSEVRVTDIHLGSLANTDIGTGEYLLPNSGIIFATRDDGLRDASNSTSESQLLSPTDFQADPTRRPTGIRLTNGETLARKPGTNSNAYNPREKGLILVSDLPAYVRGNFNLHRTNTTTSTEIEEFTQTEATGTGFYERTSPNSNFACRPGRSGCSRTDPGDYWRPATIIADSITLLSGNFVDGFRNQGDFDLNNNTGIAIRANYNPTYINASNTGSAALNLDPITTQRLRNGFLENGFVTNASWWDTTTINGTTPISSVINPRNTATGPNALGSYTLNGVTPIQRRAANTPLYVMEICRRESVSDCQPGDWVVGFDVNGNGNLNEIVTFDANGDGLVNASDTEREVKANRLGLAMAASPNFATISGNLSNNWNTAYGTNNKTIRQRLGAGDTGSINLPDAADLRFPRRVAFARNNINQLVAAAGTSNYQPLGVGCGLRLTAYTFPTPLPPNTPGTAAEFLQNGCTYGGTTEGTNYGRTFNTAPGLWFRTSNSTPSTPNGTASYQNNLPLFYYSPVDADGNGSPDLDAQPILVPVLQIHDAKNNPGNTFRTDGANQLQNEFYQRWLKQANANTTFNITFVAGISPSRPEETSAGLQNFARFLEDWTGIETKISGSFIQFIRSTFATAPLAPVARGNAGVNTATITNNLSVFDYVLDVYPINAAGGTSSFYRAPGRRWGFDVGLLSEQPDLFAQRFTLPSTGRPNEFFREIGRDDPWVKALTCSAKADNRTAIPASVGATVTYSPAITAGEYRQGCPTIPND
jgi:hypothetical protein